MRRRERLELIDFLEQGRGDRVFLATFWLARRRKLAKAILRQAEDVEAVEKLFEVLGHAVVLTERQVVREGRMVMQLLDRLLTRELSLSTGLLESSKMVAHFSKAWVILEIRFRPDEGGWLQDVRERLTARADELEIDLRGLGVSPQSGVRSRGLETPENTVGSEGWHGLR